MALLLILFASSTLSAAPPVKQYVLVVGVSGYSAPLSNLPFAHLDAEKFAQEMSKSKSNPENIVVALYDGQPKDLLPTASNIRRRLERIGDEASKEDAILVVLFGRSIQFKGETDVYFCPIDANLKDRTSIIKLGEIYATLSRAKPTQKLIVFDAVRNESSTGNGTVPIPTPQNMVPPEDINIFFPCRAGEYSSDYVEKKHSGLAYHLLEALRSEKADINRDRRLTYEELVEFAKGGSSSFHSIQFGRSVYPMTKGADPFNRVLLNLGPRAKPTMPVSLEKPDRSKGPVTETATNSLNMTLILVQPGSFRMGAADNDPLAADDERPTHMVRITKPFYLGRTEVTQDQYLRLMRRNPSWFTAGGDGADVVRGTDTRSLPVERVSWYDAIVFCNRLSEREGFIPYYAMDEKTKQVSIRGGDGYRLPTEAEWEYACRAGSDDPWSFGSDVKQLAEHAWYKENSSERTQPIAQKAPNRWGFYDMHGNVSEWCWDAYSIAAYREGAQTDPIGPRTGNIRILRGGNWLSVPGSVRSSVRQNYRPDSSFYYNGFRVARTPEP